MVIAGKLALGGTEFYQPYVGYFHSDSLKYVMFCIHLCLLVFYASMKDNLKLSFINESYGI